MRTTRLFFVLLSLIVFSVAPAQGGEERTSADAPPAAARTRSPEQEYERISQELQQTESRLAAERGELARLRHKWVVVKGRTPTEKEIQEFEKDLAKGKATPLDNPYYNKSPLSTPAPARIAYFNKLEEVRRDEERVRRLTEELAELQQKRGR